MEIEDERKARHSRAEQAFEGHDKVLSELRTASIDSANHALKALLLLNGGASLALISFLAATFKSATEVAEREAIVGSLRMFAWGAASAVLATTLAYICNSLYAGSLSDYEKEYVWPHLRETKMSKRKYAWAAFVNWLAVIVSVGSLVFFGYGVLALNDLYR